jgi:DNA-binding Xre family transcriptional regulator
MCDCESSRLREGRVLEIRFQILKSFVLINVCVCESSRLREGRVLDIRFQILKSLV